MNWQDFPTLKLLIKYAKELKIESQIVGKMGLVKFSKGKKSAFVYRTRTPLNNHTSVVISESKYLTGKILNSSSILSQRYYWCSSATTASRIARKLGFPLVVKPNVGAKGEGVTANVSSTSEFDEAVKLAFKFHPRIAVSPFFPGENYRLLVLKNEVIGAIERKPPEIIGNGKTGIKNLIAFENQKREKLNKDRFVTLMKIEIDDEVKRILEKQNLKLNSVLPKDRVLYLRANANWSSGGTAKTVSLDDFHPTIIETAIRASKAIGLQFAGVDMIIKDIKKPFSKENGVVLELNSSPAIGVFHQPFTGKPKKIAPLLLKALLV